MEAGFINNFRAIFLLFLFLWHTCSFSIIPIPVSVVEFDSVTLDCDGSSNIIKRWEVDNKTLFSENKARDEEADTEFQVDSDYSLMVKNVTAKRKGIYSCFRDYSLIVKYNLTIGVIPKLYLLFDGNEFAGNTTSYSVLLPRNERVAIVCVALKARPAVGLTWMVNGVRSLDVYNQRVTKNKIKNITFDIESTLRLLPQDNYINVTCLYSDIRNVSLILDVELQIPDPNQLKEPSENALRLEWVIFAVTAVLISLFGLIAAVVGGYSIRRRKRFRNSIAFKERLEGTNQLASTSRGQLILEINVDQTQLADVEEDTISACKAKTPEDVTLITKLPGDGLITAWIAKRNDKMKDSTQFIARSVTERAQMSDLYNFKALAVHLRKLKKYRYLVELIGASVDEVPYFIYQEYIDCGTLKDFLMRTYQQKRASRYNLFAKEGKHTKNSRHRLTSFARYIVSGMEFLASRKYHHPALSARKVLLTKNGNCKLYDFWPKTLTLHRTQQILRKNSVPIAWLAPETVFLQNYVTESDVWSFAVVLWEIFSLGETPYVGMTCEDIELKIRNDECLGQPLTCPGAVYGIMLSSWDRNLKKRPTFSYLREQLNSLPGSVRINEAATYQGVEGDEQEPPDYFTLNHKPPKDNYIG